MVELIPNPAERAFTRKRRLRRGLLLAIGILYLFSVPWYRADDAPLRILFGFPDWVAAALGCYFGVAILNAIVWLNTEIPEAFEAEDSAGTPQGESLE